MFNYILKILGSKIYEIELIKDDPKRIQEIQNAIQILRDGQGYLTNENPKRIIFYKELF